MLCIFFDNSCNVEDVQVGHIYISIFDSAGAVFGVRKNDGTEYVRINTFGEDGVDVGAMSIFDPCYSRQRVE